MKAAAKEEAGRECVNSQTIMKEKGIMNAPSSAQN